MNKNTLKIISLFLIISLNITANPKQQALFKAITSGSLTEILNAIKDGGDVNKVYENKTPLRFAAGLHYLAWANAGYPKYYPLRGIDHHAAIDILLNHGANPLTPDPDGKTIVDYAKERQLPGLLESLKNFNYL